MTHPTAANPASVRIVVATYVSEELVMTAEAAASTLAHYIRLAFPDGYLSPDSHAELEEAVLAFGELDRNIARLNEAVRRGAQP